MPAAQRDDLRRAGIARVAEHQSWEAVTDRYEKLLLGLTRRTVRTLDIQSG